MLCRRMTNLKLAVCALAPFFVLCEDIRVGVAVLQASSYYVSKDASASVQGTVRFVQNGENGDVAVTIEATGLNASASQLGFHVHQYGDATSTLDVSTLGVHLMPSCTDICVNDSRHGFPPNPVRQWGDMSNLNIDAGNAVNTETLGQSKMSLTASGSDAGGKVWNQRSIVGRAVVIHSRVDDGSQPFGNAGPPHAWGIIGIAVPPPGDSNVAEAYTAQRTVCVFQRSPDHPELTVTGTALVKWSYADNQLRLQAKLYNLEQGQYSFHFHEFGDRTVDPNGPNAPLGLIYSDTGINIDLLDATGSFETIFDSNFAGTSSDVTKLIGRMLTVHSGPSKTSPTIGTATCGRAAPVTELFDSSDPPESNSNDAVSARISIGGALLSAVFATLFSCTVVLKLSNDAAFLYL